MENIILFASENLETQEKKKKEEMGEKREILNFWLVSEYVVCNLMFIIQDL